MSGKSAAVSAASFHGWSEVFLAASGLFFLLGNYYLYVMNLELRSKLPEAERNSLRARLSPLPLHREHCPDSQTRKKCLICAVTVILCGYLAFMSWMK
jgi:hypothetical protein